MKNGLTCISFSWKRRGDVFPRVLHIDAGDNVAFNLRALHLEVKGSAGNAHHVCRGFGRGLGRSNGDDALRQHSSASCDQSVSGLAVIAAMRASGP